MHAQTDNYTQNPDHTTYDITFTIEEGEGDYYLEIFDGSENIFLVLNTQEYCQHDNQCQHERNYNKPAYENHNITIKNLYHNGTSTNHILATTQYPITLPQDELLLQQWLNNIPYIENSTIEIQDENRNITFDN